MGVVNKVIAAGAVAVVAYMFVGLRQVKRGCKFCFTGKLWSLHCVALDCRCTTS